MFTIITEAQRKLLDAVMDAEISPAEKDAITAAAYAAFNLTNSRIVTQPLKDETMRNLVAQRRVYINKT